jgi:hypothetical protein
MWNLPEPRQPLVSFGMTSLVLGSIGLLLFFLPVLGIPIAVMGMLFGMIALLEALYSVSSNLRWSLGGLGLCSLALLVNVALAYAPWGYIPSRNVPPPWEPPPGKPYISPPARPGGVFAP